MYNRVEVVSKECIKPSHPTPKHLRTYDLSFIDQLIPFNHIPILLFYSHGAQSLSSLKQSLSKALASFYPFAGELVGNSHVDCNDQGVEFLHAKVSQPLCDVVAATDFNPELMPCGAACCTRHSNRLLSVQVSAFDCGGVAIGACVSHKIADAISMTSFLNAWAASARCTDINDPQMIMSRPILDAASLFLPVENIPAVSLEGPTEKTIVLRRFTFDATKIAALRSGGDMEDGSRPTRVEALTALLWRGITRARAKAGGKGPAMAVHSVDLRRRMVPPLPDRAFGNMCGVAVLPPVSETDTDVRPRFDQQLRTAVNGIGDGYVRKHLGPGGFLQAVKLVEEAFGWSGAAGTPVAEHYCFSSWCHFPLYGVDFGWGEPQRVALGKAFPNNSVTLMDGREEGVVEAWLSITEDEITELERDHELRCFAN